MLNKEELKAVVNKNETSKNIFYVLGTRQRTRHTTDLVRFKLFLTKHFGPIDDVDFKETFESLVKLNVGKIVGSKFIWSYDLIQVARFAMNGEKIPESIGERRRRRVLRAVAVEKEQPKQEQPQESPVFPGVRVDIRRGDTTISTTLNTEQLMEVLKKLG